MTCGTDRKIDGVASENALLLHKGGESMRDGESEERMAERIAICVEAGVSELRARQIAGCEERVQQGAERCTCGAGHEPPRGRR